MKKLIFCTQKVNKSNIKRENRKGVEHIVITSYTLPPNIVMNGGLYPSDEIEKSFESLNRTPVTIEHPEINGVFVSANDPEVDFDFRFGAFNENARKSDDGRIMLDKVINVQKALKVEKGRRLLDRIEEIETSEKARPMHTSVGVFLDIEELESPSNEYQGNETNAEYSWIGRNMIFDHDAILLDSCGASTPEQGTGIGINKGLFNNSKVNVEQVIINCDASEEGYLDAPNDLRTNKDISFDEIHTSLHQQMNLGLGDDEYIYIIDIFDDYFIYKMNSGEMFKAMYEVDSNNNIKISNSRLPVERVIEYKTITTETEEDSAMRDQIIAELAKLGITVNTDISDAELMAKYNEALTAKPGDDTQPDIAEVVANAVSKAVEPLNEKMTGLENQLKANQTEELDQLATVIVNSGKYTGLDVDNIKTLGLDKARSMAANCGVSRGIGSTMLNNNQQDDSFKVNTKVDDLPE